jgi:hypothetical protein
VEPLNREILSNDNLRLTCTTFGPFLSHHMDDRLLPLE